MRQQLGLDQPLYRQYLTWIASLIRGNWGRSIQLRREILPLILGRFRTTAMLAFTAIFFAALGGIATGVVAAFKRFTYWDRLVTFLAIAGFSIPVFWSGLILQLVFGLKLNWMPVSGLTSVTGGGALDMLHHLVLPIIALLVGPMALIARMTRSSMLEIIGEDYITTARSKGLSERIVVVKHVLKNAFIPTLTVIGMQMGFVLAGSVFVEMIFAWPGIGALMLNGILARDFPLIQGSILIIALIHVFINLIIDLLYAYVNPVIRYG
jgi:peptide/nickel transport system permease protein